MEKKSSESGQILVFLVLGMVGLLGFAALALDGGLIYSDRRYAQNASDASSLAGGGSAGLVLDQIEYINFTCGLPGVTTARQAAVAAAINRAASNDFLIAAGATTTPGENEVTTDCTVFDNGGFVEKYVDVKVRLAEDVETALIQFVYSGNVRNVVDSVTRIYPRMPLTFGDAIVSLSPECQGNDGGVTLDGGGNSEININGGGIFSNSCLDVNGTSLDICVDAAPYEECDGDGDIAYITEYLQSGNPGIQPPPEQATVPMPTFNVPAPNCDSLPFMGDHNGDGNISPGRYTRIKLPNGALTMQPGLYCLTGEFAVTGGSLTGADVTIFMGQGDFATAGNATINLDAPPSGCNTSGGTPGCPPSMPGMLIFMPESNPGTITIEGDGASHLEGTVYAPSGTIDLGGGSSTMSSVSLQLIGYTVKVHGNVTIDINYDDQLVYKLPATLQLHQ